MLTQVERELVHAKRSGIPKVRTLDYKVEVATPYQSGIELFFNPIRIGAFHVSRANLSYLRRDHVSIV